MERSTSSSSNPVPRALQVVVVAPHPDDAELGMGGTIARLVEEGHNVLIVDMTDGEPTPKGSRELRAAETLEATRILRCGRQQLGLKNREVTSTIEARHALAAVLRRWRCDILFLPHPEDAHPDHLAVTRIGEDARFDAKLTKSAIEGAPIYPQKLFYYYCTHLRAMPTPSFALDMSAFVERKRNAILAYRSQVIDHAPNRGLIDWLEARDRFVGSQIGTAAAEPFWSRELLGPSQLSALLLQA
ncbi:MAG: bacillithiol biosynthesis deacetylase BshB1 [Phycisphaerales bacterium]|nr:bacillithiol biosynthesis deacetylase BshB1 [Phycisphaerales bacterium]